METTEEELTSPRLEAIEERLTRNYDEFRAIGMEWTREWQRLLTNRRKQRQRARESAAPLHRDSA